MKIKLLFFSILTVVLLPLTASAQSSVYVVAEGGVSNNLMALSGITAGLPKTEESSGSFGGAIGYRALVSDNFIAGFEGSIASSSAKSSVDDGFDTITNEEDYVAGLYVTGGFAFGAQQEALIYALLGVGYVGGETRRVGVSGNEIVENNGNGFSFGGAFEYGITESLGIRAKIVHTRVRGDVDEIKIRNTSVMGGIVFSF